MACPSGGFGQPLRNAQLPGGAGAETGGPPLRGAAEAVARAVSPRLRRVKAATGDEEMLERLNTHADAFRHGLEIALTMECDVVEALGELGDKAHDAAVKRALGAHQSETRGHVSSVEKVFELLGWDVEGSPSPALAALEGEGAVSIERADEAIADSVILARAIVTEHHEIAAYENLIILARALDRRDAAELLERNCRDERVALEKVKELAQACAQMGSARSA
jgi:ferritin-like metal-binding protein YciE